VKTARQLTLRYGNAITSRFTAAQGLFAFDSLRKNVSILGLSQAVIPSHSRHLT
jgi:hypothetical protein